MSKWDEQILVVNRKVLFNNEENHFYGFIEKNDEKTRKIISTFESYEVKRRGDMEEDPNYKQLIGYVLLKDEVTGEVLVYKRLVGGGEARLHGKASVGIGGHMNEVEGKTIFEFEQSDWLDCGLETVEGAVKGCISGYAIYGLTNVFKMSAPNASAFVTASYGMVDIITKLRTNEITEDEFINFITINTLDTTLATIGSCVGQTLIPVPVLGAVVGSIATSIIWEIGKGILSDREQELIQNYRENLDNHIKNLDDKYKIIFNDIMDKYHKLGRLQDYSFDLSINTRLRFEYSIELAEYIGVSDDEILHDLSEIDSYFLS